MIFASHQQELEFKVFHDRIDLTRSRPLNPAYLRIAGAPKEFDADFVKLKEEGGDLIAMQEKHERLGYKMAELIKTGAGWAVVSKTPSGIEHIYRPDENGLLFNLTDALDAGTRWVNEDFDHREFIVRKNLVENI